MINFSTVLKIKDPYTGYRFSGITLSTYSVEAMRKVLTTDKKIFVFSKQGSSSFKAIWKIICTYQEKI